MPNSSLDPNIIEATLPQQGHKNVYATAYGILMWAFVILMETTLVTYLDLRVVHARHPYNVTDTKNVTLFGVHGYVRHQHSSSGEKGIVRYMKERLAYVASDYEEELGNSKTSSAMKQDGIHRLTFQSIRKLDLDMKKNLYNSVVMFGASSHPRTPLQNTNGDQVRRIPGRVPHIVGTDLAVVGLWQRVLRQGTPSSGGVKHERSSIVRLQQKGVTNEMRNPFAQVSNGIPSDPLLGTFGEERDDDLLSEVSSAQPSPSRPSRTVRRKALGMGNGQFVPCNDEGCAVRWNERLERN